VQAEPLKNGYKMKQKEKEKETQLTTAPLQPVLTASTTQGKSLLVANTDQAFADGAFGLPWMMCTNAAGETEGFFGVDHLGQVAEFLGLRKDGDEVKGKGWRALL
jgi:hypothetical protein